MREAAMRHASGDHVEIAAMLVMRRNASYDKARWPHDAEGRDVE